MNNFFYVLNGRKIKRFFLIFAAALFAAGIIYVEQGHVTVFSDESSPSAVYSVSTDKKIVALTFDISWGDKRTEPILKVLKDKNVQKATFFLSSPWSKTHPEIVKSIQQQGFEIGSHGHKHVNYSTLSEEEIAEQIKAAHTILTDVTGTEPKLLRLPNGDFDKRVLSIAENQGYKVIQWDTDSQDWMNKGVQTIVDRVVSKAHAGDIILLHASDSVNQTHEALPQIIDQLRQKGFDFVSVTDLIQEASAEGKEVHDQTWNEQKMNHASN